MKGIVLVLNAGSSSLKFAAFEAGEGALPARCAGQIEGIGAAPRFTARDAGGAKIAERDWQGGGAPASHAAALGEIIGWLEGALQGAPVIAVGHRVVHGGPDFAEPMLIDLGIMAELQELVALAPLHQPHNLAGITAAARRFRGVPQVACFDTAFHRTQPPVADTFGLPPAFHAQGIRRYGFHGLSYEYIARRIAEEDAALGAGRLVVAHLGNGASLCGILDGRSQGSSMGFTALDGLPMGTRCGQLDPGVVLHMIDTLKMSTAEVTKLLYNGSGLKGMSGISQDVREIEAAGGPAAEAALAYFAHRVKREIAALAAALGGIDALIFTAGIGENARGLRARICEGLDFMGLRLDAARNAANAPEIGQDGAPVRILVRRTDEERMIAAHTMRVVTAARAA
ncbi:acetate/propionate family kinase [Falsiroseomonas selenitidurans]|uniref:Acetate kinase n=1 Tax=Falsiroseomonas selenitidurans TaxID=2716335 RepID=A0ABX1E3A1_9PROT|nr:acetate/propionate family kinase [Falsiroseomonas selenitidurans]NKC31170.1 acetate/propionate family kinase [Falsiroseomonas selenitidurans]